MRYRTPDPSDVENTCTPLPRHASRPPPSSRTSKQSLQLESLEGKVEASERTSRALMDMVRQLASDGGPGTERLHRILHPRSNDPPDLEPEGWFRGNLPGLGKCGGPGGRLSAVWEIWAGTGPAFVLGKGAGMNLKSHGHVTQRQANSWGSASTYSRYKLVGRYMESILQLVQVSDWGCSFRDPYTEHSLSCPSFVFRPCPDPLLSRVVP